MLTFLALNYPAGLTGLTGESPTGDSHSALCIGAAILHSSVSPSGIQKHTDSQETADGHAFEGLSDPTIVKLLTVTFLRINEFKFLFFMVNKFLVVAKASLASFCIYNL